MNLNIKILAAGALVFVLAASGAFIYFRADEKTAKMPGEVEAPQRNPEAANRANQLTNIENQLSTALKGSKGIHPDTYKEIDDQLLQLEAAGINTVAARALLAQFEISTLNSGAPEKTAGEIMPVPAATSSSKPAPPTPPASKFNPQPPPQNLAPQPASFQSSCVSNPAPVFTHHITDMNQVDYVVPPPTMGAGPSLKPHGYIGTNHARVPVYAPTALTLRRGAHFTGGPYMMELSASCEVKVRFIHITEPVEAIRNLLPKEPKPGSQDQDLAPLKFKAGELLGYTTGTAAAGNWDFGVYNSSTSNRYAGDPTWGNSSVYTTAVCPFDYFPPELKAEYTTRFDSKILGGNPPHGESFCR